jgi:SAM-dependent methyltransferase
MSWQIFEKAATRYDAWYDTPRGQRVERAERALLGDLLRAFPGARSLLEVGCGTGRFLGWLASTFRVVGIDRSPGMLAEMRARHPIIPAILGDAHRLPLRDGAVDLVVLVATLEFLDDPPAALSEAVRVARRGVILVALNRWSAGGLSRRVGAQARSGLRGEAHDVSLRALRAMAVDAGGVRLVALPWASTLFPGRLWAARARVPLGEVLGMALVLAQPAREASPRFPSGRSPGASARAGPTARAGPDGVAYATLSHANSARCPTRGTGRERNGWGGWCGQRVRSHGDR